MKKINVGIIGCGWFGNVHIDNLLQMESVNIVALVSTNKIKLEITSKKVLSAKLFDNHYDMFNDKSLKLDAIVLCLPPAMHNDIESIAASLGICMYIEKPIGLSLDTVKQIQKQIEDSSIITCVGYQALCNPLLQEIKTKLKHEKVGLVQGNWISDFPQVYWWRDKLLSGGQIVEQSTHIFSALYYLFGDVKSIYAQGTSGINNYDNSTVLDYSSCILTFKSGIIATIMSGCYKDDESNSQIGFKIHSATTTISYDWSQKLTIQDGHSKITKTNDENNHFNCMQLFINAVMTNDKTLILSDYAHGVKVLEITLCANQSIDLGQVVYLD